MVVGSCHGVRRTKEGPGQAQNGVETLMHRTWVTHHHCPLALEQSVTGGAGTNVNQKKKKKIIYNIFSNILHPVDQPENPVDRAGGPSS